MRRIEEQRMEKEYCRGQLYEQKIKNKKEKERKEKEKRLHCWKERVTESEEKG